MKKTSVLVTLNIWYNNIKIKYHPRGFFMRFSKSALILFTYVFAMFFLPTISLLLLLNFTSITEETSLKVYVNLISYIFLMIVTLRLFGKQIIEDFKKINSVGEFIKGTLIGWCLLLVCLMISNYLLFFVKGIYESSENQQVIVNVMEVHPILMAMTTVIFAPVVEEIIFRMTLMKKTLLHPWVSILLSSLLFGLIHVIAAGDFIFVIPYMAMGIPLGYSYYKTKNICYPIGIHILQNLFSTLMITVPFFLSY